MKQNLLVTSANYSLSKEVAKRLADGFSMRFFDQRELFEFDHIPRTIEEVVLECGEEYLARKFRSSLKMELDYEDTAFVADIRFVINSADLFYKIRLTNFVILLSGEQVKAELESIPQNKEHEMAVRMELADIEIDTASKTIDEIVLEIVDKIQNYKF